MIIDTDAKRAVRSAELKRMDIKQMPLGPTLADLVREHRAVTYLVVEDVNGMRELQPRHTSAWWSLLTQPSRAAGRSRVIAFLEEVGSDDDLRQLVRDAEIDLEFFREGLECDA